MQTTDPDNGLSHESTPTVDPVVQQPNPPQSTQTRPIIPGDVIGGSYQVLELLGRGGMGAVYRAKHINMPVEYALKVLIAERLTDNSVMRFQNEAQAIAKLNHPNVIAIYNYGLHEGRLPFYVMDLLNGENLLDKLDRDGPAPVGMALSLFIEVCAGLSHAHRKGILHRDVKPANIVILNAPDVRGALVKVVDFGIVKFSEEFKSEMQKLTAMGSVVGSPSYMSPEQSNSEKIDTRSDVYSLGCSLFQTLTGRVPFHGRSATDTMLLHQEMAAPTLAEKGAGRIYSEDLELLVAKMLAKAPMDRYQTMEAVAQDLRNVLDGKPLGTLKPLPTKASTATGNFEPMIAPPRPAQRNTRATTYDIRLAERTDPHPVLELRLGNTGSGEPDGPGELDGRGELDQLDRLTSQIQSDRRDGGSSRADLERFVVETFDIDGTGSAAALKTNLDSAEMESAGAVYTTTGGTEIEGTGQSTFGGGELTGERRQRKTTAKLRWILGISACLTCAIVFFVLQALQPRKPAIVSSAPVKSTLNEATPADLDDSGPVELTKAPYFSRTISINGRQFTQFNFPNQKGEALAWIATSLGASKRTEGQVTFPRGVPIYLMPLPGAEKVPEFFKKFRPNEIAGLLLGPTTASDEMFESATRVPGLACLLLPRCDQLTEKIMPTLSKLNLTSFNCSGLSIDGEKLAKAHFWQNLQTLNMSKYKYPTPILKKLAGSKKLTTLDVSDIKLSNTDYQLIARLPNLRALNLRSNGLTGEDLRTLSRLPKLTTICAVYARLSGGSIVDELKKFPALREIDVIRGFIKEAELQQLKQSCPNLVVQELTMDQINRMGKNVLKEHW